MGKAIWLNSLALRCDQLASRVWMFGQWEPNDAVNDQQELFVATGGKLVGDGHPRDVLFRLLWVLSVMRRCNSLAKLSTDSASAER